MPSLIPRMQNNDFNITNREIFTKTKNIHHHNKSNKSDKMLSIFENSPFLQPSRVTENEKRVQKTIN